MAGSNNFNITPGPWKYLAGSTDECGAITARTGWICDFGGSEPKQINAELMAKAPEMLGVIERLVDEISGDDEVFYDTESQTVRYGLKSVVEQARKILKSLGDNGESSQPRSKVLKQ
jgi:hypothetical protein